LVLNPVSSAGNDEKSTRFMRPRSSA
jgi:hypothetical protein